MSLFLLCKEECKTSTLISDVFLSFYRSTSEISSISYSGYLLKRSNTSSHNSSAQQLSSLPLDTALDTSVDGCYVLAPQSHIVAEIMIGEAAATEESPTLPQHLLLDVADNGEAETKEEETSFETEKSPLEQSIDHIASFFGIHKPGKPKEEDQEETKSIDDSSTKASLSNEPPPSPTVCPATPPQPIGTRSAPISVTSKIQSQMPTLPFDDDVLRFLHRGDSAPSVMKQASVDDSAMPPADIVDAKDGHLWRAKYCVLENGILYFYRNAHDGESQEAKLERVRSLEESTPNATPNDLSKSPTPRKLLNTALSYNKHEEHSTAGVIYEKRVFLDRVGAVRSADNKYGECSFELLAVPDDGGAEGMYSPFVSDKLVLRARNADEMREWLFQFHRYLATLMKNIIETAVGFGGLTVPVGDIHHPSFAATQFPPHEMGLHTNYKFSPRSMVYPSGAHFPAALTHGHGQSSALRRKRASVKRDTPSSTPSGSPSQPSYAAHDYETTTKLTPIQGDRTQPLQSQPAVEVEKELPPEFSRPPETCPETERPPPAPRGGKYVPPHLRNKQQSDGSGTPVIKTTGRSLSDLLVETSEPTMPANVQHLEESAYSPLSHYSAGDAAFEMSIDEHPRMGRVTPTEDRSVGSAGKRRANPFKLGGCADPQVVVGSILDSMFIPRSASKVGQVHTEDHGAFGGGKRGSIASVLQWEIGAVSKCGIRESNEDSYLVASNLSQGFDSLRPGMSEYSSLVESGRHDPGLFCIFDGHGGNHGARFAAEKFPEFLLEEARAHSRRFGSDDGGGERMEDILRKAIRNLDDAFCNLCTADGRDWGSGATAMIVLVVEEHLVIANLGDCRGMLCRSVDESDVASLKLHSGDDGWTKLDLETEQDLPGGFTCFFQEVSEIHSPGRPDERARVERANGWVTIETEMPSGQLQRMDFCDQDVIEILKRHYLDRFNKRESSNSAPERFVEISRVCGDLAVSRALGDHEYKAAYNNSFENGTDDEPSEWQSAELFLPYPDGHNERFRGDLVSAIPDIQRLGLAEAGVFNEFLLLACDGLWDVMDPDDAIRVTRGLLYEKKWEAKRAVSISYRAGVSMHRQCTIFSRFCLAPFSSFQAARLAELAIHLGSSDNVTVIVVRFFKNQDSRD